MNALIQSTLLKKKLLTENNDIKLHTTDTTRYFNTNRRY